ncbi:MAG: hypothetical protein U0Q16_24565 [Bryobacteraceae bacterium]
MLMLAGMGLFAQMVPPFQGHSVIRFVVFDLSGKPAPYEIRRFGLKGGGLSQARIAGMEVANVAQGEYEYDLVRAGLRRPRASAIRGSMVTWKPEHLVVLVETGVYGVSSDGDEVVFDGAASRPLTGKVRGCPEVSRGRCWARLMNQLTGKSTDFPIRADGSFRVETPPGGYCVLSIFGTSGFVCNRTVFVPPGGPVSPLEVACGS